MPSNHRQYNYLMASHSSRRILFIPLVIILILMFTSSARAATDKIPALAGWAYELIEAVNKLRVSYGLPAYAISAVLIMTAQNQADYMAATGIVSHTGAGGTSVTDRLLAAGYPLAGDLSLGGFRSENITAGNESLSAQAAVNQWAGDSVHLNTMISPSLSEIGARVSVNGGKVYYVIDSALPTLGNTPQAAVTSLAGGSAVPEAGIGVMIPVEISTPNADGDLIHEVRAGQTLWQIAISYNTKIDEIKRLNNLLDNNIYPGTKLLIRKGVIPTSVLPTETSAFVATLSPTVFARPTAMPPALTSTIAALPPPLKMPNGRMFQIALSILARAILGGALVALYGKAKQ